MYSTNVSVDQMSRVCLLSIGHSPGTSAYTVSLHLQPFVILVTFFPYEEMYV